MSSFIVTPLMSMMGGTSCELKTVLGTTSFSRADSEVSTPASFRGEGGAAVTTEARHKENTAGLKKRMLTARGAMRSTRDVRVYGSRARVGRCRDSGE